jgi:hypothetical protein
MLLVWRLKQNRLPKRNVLVFIHGDQKSLCTWWLQYKKHAEKWPSQNTFGMWTVLYWTRSSRTQFGVSIIVGRLVGDTWNITCNFLYHVLIVLESWNLKLLEPSGPVQSCNGIALPKFWPHSVFVCFVWIAEETAIIYYTALTDWFLGAFAKLRKATLCFSVCLSISLSFRPLGKTRFPLDGFLWNFIFDYFSKIGGEDSSIVAIWQE